MLNRTLKVRALLVMVCCGVTGCLSSSGSDTRDSTVYETSPDRQRNLDSQSGFDEVVAVGEDIQTALDRAGEDGEILLLEGVHRTGNLRPRQGQLVTGEPGTILSGMELIGPFVEQGPGVWVAGVPMLLESERGICRREQQICTQPQDLVVDGELLQRVGEPSQLDDRSWYLDSELKHVVLRFNPGDKKAEVGVRPFAFAGNATNVTIRALVIEGYASSAQQGAIRGRNGWKVIDNEIRFNHAVGVKTAGEMTIANNHIHHNGHFGLSGGGVDVEVRGNEIAYNGVAGYSPFWGAGGAKFVATQRLKVAENLVYGNRGAGLWTDGAGGDTTYAENRVCDNEHAGIKHEISGSVVIERNEVAGNGFEHEFPPRGAGVLVRESGPAVIRDNVVHGNADELILLQQNDRENPKDQSLNDISVERNSFWIDQGSVGFLGDIMPNLDITFENNVYLGDLGREWFLLQGRRVRWTEWQEAGYDQTSTFEARDEQLASRCS